MTTSAEQVIARFKELDAAGKTVVVAVGQVGWVDLDLMPPIRTHDMGSASVVLIGSKDSAILAHLPSLPPEPEPIPKAREQHDRSLMREIKMVYECFAALSSDPDFRSIIIYATHRGVVVMPEQLGVIMQGLQDMGLEIEKRPYSLPHDPELRRHGSVFLVSNQDGRLPSVCMASRHIG